MYPADFPGEPSNSPLIRMPVEVGQSLEQIIADMDAIQRVMTTTYPNLTPADLLLPALSPADR